MMQNFGFKISLMKENVPGMILVKKYFEINKIEIDLQPIPTLAYPTPAKRPAFSVLDKSKIKKVFGVEILEWEVSLKNQA